MPAFATEADAPALARLVNAAYRGAGGRLGWTNETALIAGDRAAAADIAALIRGGATVLVRRGEESDALLGCVAVEPDGPGAAMISMLAVAPDRQGRALGDALLADAERRAAESGAATARMTVVQQRDDLIAWYERRGYVQAGHRPFPYGDPRVGEPLRGDLRFVVLEKPLPPTGSG